MVGGAVGGGDARSWGGEIGGGVAVRIGAAGGAVAGASAPPVGAATGAAAVGTATGASGGSAGGIHGGSAGGAAGNSNGASPPEPKPAVQTDTQLEPSSAQQRSEAKPPGALHEVTSMASPLMSSAVHPSHRQPSALMYEASALYAVGVTVRVAVGAHGIGMSGGPSPASWSRLPR